MMEQAVKDSLIKKNKELYDTINVYSEFVGFYHVKEGDKPYLRVALLKIFANEEGGEYKIMDNSGAVILSTNLTSGKITYFRESHKKMLIEMFIGKCDNDGTINQYDDKTKKENYCKAINNCSVWKAFTDMK